MEQIDQKIAEALADPAPADDLGEGPATILVVCDDPALRASILRVLGKRGHEAAPAGGLREARAAIARARFDLLVIAADSAEGDALSLIALVNRTSPSTKTLVLSPSASAADAVRALRSGAVDYVALPFDPADFAQRVNVALLKSRAERHRDDRLVRLKKICHELNVARREIARQVDVLCEDLANVYQDFAEQMTEVAMSAEFRTLLRQELDVEDLLRTTLEYLLTKTGPTNAAVFLPDSSESYGLGAYVNYDCPRETISSMLDHLCDAICPQMADEPDIVSFNDAKDFADWLGAEADFLADSQVLAFSCRHKGDCLAVIVLFRNRNQPFDEKLGTAIETLRSIIGEQLRNVIRVHHRSQPSWPKDAADGDYDCDDYGFGGHEGGLAA